MIMRKRDFCDREDYFDDGRERESERKVFRKRKIKACSFEGGLEGFLARFQAKALELDKRNKMPKDWRGFCEC
jgi:hypothetical protein